MKNDVRVRQHCTFNTTYEAPAVDIVPTTHPFVILEANWRKRDIKPVCVAKGSAKRSKSLASPRKPDSVKAFSNTTRGGGGALSASAKSTANNGCRERAVSKLNAVTPRMSPIVPRGFDETVDFEDNNVDKGLSQYVGNRLDCCGVGRVCLGDLGSRGALTGSIAVLYRTNGMSGSTRVITQHTDRKPNALCGDTYSKILPHTCMTGGTCILRPSSGVNVDVLSPIQTTFVLWDPYYHTAVPPAGLTRQ